MTADSDDQGQRDGCRDDLPLAPHRVELAGRVPGCVLNADREDAAAGVVTSNAGPSKAMKSRDEEERHGQKGP